MVTMMVRMTKGDQALTIWPKLWRLAASGALPALVLVFLS